MEQEDECTFNVSTGPEHTEPLTALPYLGGEVSVKDALAVQVLQPSGNVQRETDPDAPRQVQVTVQQLFQVPAIYILTDREKARR